MDMTPAALIRQALHRSGVSARELSRRTGLTEGRVSDYLNGRYDPGAGRFMDMLTAAGMRLHIEPDLDRNGLILAELLDLGDALAVGMHKQRDLAIPSFADLTAPHG